MRNHYPIFPPGGQIRRSGSGGTSLTDEELMDLIRQNNKKFLESAEGAHA
jgi:hypothetical protein